MNTRTTKTFTLDSLDSLSDAALLDLLALAMTEAVERGLDTTDPRANTRQAAEEAAKAAAKAKAEADRIAAKAAAEKAQALAARVRQVAVDSRAFFGYDTDYKVKVWEKTGEKRVYVGPEFNDNWVEYYHTGNSRVAPGTIKIRPVIIRLLAEHLEISRDEATNRIKEFCRSTCDGWRGLEVEVTPDNAPAPPECKATHYRVRSDTPRGNRSVNYLAKGDSGPYVGGRDEALAWRSREAAEKALQSEIPKISETAFQDPAVWRVEPFTAILNFPIKAPATQAAQ